MRSITWRRLAWILTREAALRVAFPYPAAHEPHSQARARIAPMPTDRLRAAAEQILALDPQRAYWPPRP